MVSAKKKNYFFSYSVSLKSKKQNKPTNPQSEFDSKSKPWNFRERKRESKRVLANLAVVVLNWVFVALFCKHFDFSRDQKRLYFSLSLWRLEKHTLVNIYIWSPVKLS